MRPPGQAEVRRAGAFTLIEILVATAISMIIIVVLVGLSGEAGRHWKRNQTLSQLREQARTAMDFIGGEMQQAVAPISSSATNGPQFLVNPSLGSAYNNAGSAFWQIPGGEGSTDGNLLIVGYFVRRDAEGPRLCRLMLRPGDPDYALYQPSGSWLTDDLLDRRTAANKASDFEGLMLPNVVGIWFQPVETDGTVVSDWDSRLKDGRFPDHVIVSHVSLDSQGITLVKSGATTLPEATTAVDAEDYFQKLPVNLKPFAGLASFHVDFRDRQ